MRHQEREQQPHRDFSSGRRAGSFHISLDFACRGEQTTLVQKSLVRFSDAEAEEGDEPVGEVYLKVASSKPGETLSLLVRCVMGFLGTYPLWAQLMQDFPI